MKRLITAMALAATAVLPVACDREAGPNTADDTAVTAPAPGADTTSPPASSAPTPPPTGEPTTAAPASAPGAPSFAVLYPGATVDAPAVTASGPAGPGGLVTFTTDAAPDVVIAFYKTRAEAAGLASVMAMNQGDARAYGAADTAAGANLQVVASPTEGGQTSVQLSWSAGQ